MKKTNTSLATRHKALPSVVPREAVLSLLLAMLLGCGQKGPLTLPPSYASPAAAKAVGAVSAASAPAAPGTTPAR